MDDDSDDEPQLRDAERVVAVRGPSGLLRVVAERRPLLVVVERIHRRVNVEDVVLAPSSKTPKLPAANLW